MSMMVVRCIEQFSTSRMTFKAGESYTGNSVNENWWVVDSTGVKTEDFHLHFEIIEEVVDEELIKEMSAPAYNRHIEWSEPSILPGWLDDEDEKTTDEGEKDSLWSKIKQWYDDWEIIQWQYRNGL